MSEAIRLAALAVNSIGKLQSKFVEFRLRFLAQLYLKLPFHSQDGIFVRYRKIGNYFTKGIGPYEAHTLNFVRIRN